MLTAEYRKSRRYANLQKNNHDSSKVAQNKYNKFKSYHKGKFSNWLITTVIWLLPVLTYGQTIRIMPLGNSVTHGQHGSNPIGGYRDDLAYLLLDEGINFDFVGTLHDGTNFYPMHEGHSGWSARRIKHHILEYLMPTQPDIVMIHLGTNDINGGEIAGATEDQIEIIVDTIHTYDPEIIVLLATIIPRKDSLDSEHDALRGLIWNLVQNKIKAGYPIYYCGVNELFKARSNWRSVYMTDLLHPNNDGYNVIARVFYKSLMNVINAEGVFITDNFNRRQLNSCWTSNASYTIHNGHLVNTNGNSGKHIAIYQIEANPKSVSITYGQNVDPSQPGEIGLALRLDDNDTKADGYVICKESATGDLVLSHVEDGAANYEIDRITGINPIPVEGDTFKVVIHTSGYGHFFDCYLNGHFDGRVVDSQSLEGRYGTLYAGVISVGNINNQIDNFNLSFANEPPCNDPVQLVSISGDAQEAVVNTTLLEPLIAELRDPEGNGVSDIAVDFKIQDEGGHVYTETSSGMIGLELEFSTLSSPMICVEDDSASAGAYLFTPQDSLPNTGSAEMTIYIAKTGNYGIWGRVFASNTTHNSLGLILDNSSEINWNLDSAGRWYWDQVGEDPKIFHLTQGYHVLRVNAKETNVRLDRFIITTTISFNPEDTKKGSNEFYTDTNGQVRGYVLLPKFAGSVTVATSVPDYHLPAATFTATARADTPSQLQIVKGNNQYGIPSAQLDQPLRISLKDQYGNISKDIPVQFDIVQGGGSIVESLPIMTDDAGEAAVHFILGPEPGNNSVRVSVPDYSTNSVTFKAIAEKVLFTISGHVRYYANDEPIPNVVMDVSGDFIYQDTTDSEGSYQIAAIPKNTDFNVKPSKLAYYGGRADLVSMYDAALIMRHYMRLETLTSIQSTAADVDRNNEILPYDAVHVARFALNLPPFQGSRVGQWVFSPRSRPYSNITVDKDHENYQAFLLGDVYGGWHNAYQLQAKVSIDSYQSEALTVTAIGDTISVPFSVDQTNILSCELFFEIMENEVEFLDIRKTKISKDFAVFHKLDSSTLHIGMFTAYPTIEKGEFLEIRFKSLVESPAPGAIVLERYRFNNEPFRNVSAIFQIQSEGQKPKSFVMHQNFPNPFNPLTIIQYEIPKSSWVNLAIYNTLGQLVRVLVDEEQAAGRYEVGWDGLDSSRNQTSGGVYIYRIVANGQIITRKMLKTK